MHVCVMRGFDTEIMSSSNLATRFADSSAARNTDGENGLFFVCIAPPQKKRKKKNEVKAKKTRFPHRSIISITPVGRRLQLLGAGLSLDRDVGFAHLCRGMHAQRGMYMHTNGEIT